MILINFSFVLVFVKKIKLNFRYKKMTEKLYDNLQEKYKIHISDYKICKVRTFGRLVILVLIRQLEKNTLVCAIV